MDACFLSVFLSLHLPTSPEYQPTFTALFSLFTLSLTFLPPSIFSKNVNELCLFNLPREKKPGSNQEVKGGVPSLPSVQYAQVSVMKVCISPCDGGVALVSASLTKESNDLCLFYSQ